MNPPVKVGNRQASQPLEEVVIRVEGLRKSYGEVVAVDGVNLTVNRGEVLGILGPSGAGKTTTLEMMVGLRKPDAGEIEVAGNDAIRESGDLKRIIGVLPQSTALFENLTVRETLKLFADLYGADASQARMRELLDVVSLTGKAKYRVEDLSAGEQRRLSLALALINDPKIIFLDEPTAGLDPQACHSLWGSVRHIRSDDKTVVLATHYVEEASELCDRVAIMDRGRIFICDTPLALVRSLNTDATILASVDIDSEEQLDTNLALLPEVTREERNGKELLLETEDARATTTALLRRAAERGMRFKHLTIRAADLEDVFVSYTGRGLRE